MSGADETEAQVDVTDNGLVALRERASTRPSDAAMLVVADGAVEVDGTPRAAAMAAELI
jgi:hypothetical protein